MKSNIIRSAYRVLLALLVCVSLDACAQNGLTSYPMTGEATLENLVTNSDLIIEGQVVSTVGFWDKGHRSVYTSAKIKPTLLFKGILRDSLIEVVYEGGGTDSGYLRLSHGINLSKETRGIFFLKPNRSAVTLYSPSATYIMFWGNKSAARYEDNPYLAKVTIDHLKYNEFQTDLFPAIEALTHVPVKVISRNIFEISQASKGNSTK